MTRFNIRKRDGLARTGIFETGSSSVKLPFALAAETLFPGLETLTGTNLPLCAPAGSLLRLAASRLQSTLCGIILHRVAIA
jgi:hypothetical protein